jgi:hypothetical protein
LAEKENKPSLRAMETLQLATEKAASEEENPEEVLDLAKDLDEDIQRRITRGKIRVCNMLF